MKLHHIAISSVLLLLCHTKAFATWSVIVLDAKTATIGVAGASCTNEVSGIAKIITGKGAIVAQAYSDDSITNRGLELLKKEAPPSEILQVLRDEAFDKEPSFRQYGIVTFAHYDAPVAFTGADISADGHSATAVSPGVSVQGNTLAGTNVVAEVHKAVTAAKKANQPIEVILMTALEVGSKFGGDRRCGAQTATTAFLQVVRPVDTYCSHLLVKTGGIKKGGPNATKVVRKEFDRSRSEMTNNKCMEVAVYPKD